MSAPSWAVPGREVVCIYDDWDDSACRLLGIRPPDRVPMLNEVLRISDVLMGEDVPSGIAGVCYLSFDGIPPFLYCATAFKPVITIEDDMAAHFNALLDVRVEA